MKYKNFTNALSALLVIVLTVFSLQSFAEADSPPVSYQVGQWLPSDQQFLDQWLSKQLGEVDPAETLLPVIAEFKKLIENDPEIYMLFHEMFDQIPRKEPYLHDPTGKPQIKDYRQMLLLMNRILVTAPEFNKTGLVGFPINAILNWAMGTEAGTAVFLNPKVNRQIKKILQEWAIFLGSKESRYVLSDAKESGWFGQNAKEAMPDFINNFNCEPEQPYYGFKSWDDFFTRTFREGIRPVASPENNAVIANACESAPYKVVRNVKLRDKFWVKAQPYSLQHMMNNDPFAQQFDGGTVYQAFLSALSYHRWHSPVSGKIVKTCLIDGSYYAQALSEGYDPAGPNNSQGYITQVATRALFFIEADNPDIGLMAIMFVGMAEVSSNEITAYQGQHVKKGDQLGMFHFGGSTHCLIFRPGVNIQFDLHGQTPGLESDNIPVRSRIGTVLK